MKNIVLIGMPACGKSTIGALLSKKTGRKLIDTDKTVVENEGRSIPDIFEHDGEKYFREAEKRAVKEASSTEGTIISCGGGAILNEENAKNLKENGIIVLIKRDVGLLSTKGRPLSKNTETLMNMEKIRMPIYEKHADFTVINDGTPEEAAEKILRGIQ